MKCNRWIATVGTALLACAFLSGSALGQDHESFAGKKDIQHVLLISVDGMHAVDFLNCSKGLAGVNNGQPYCPNLAELGETGVDYLDTSTSKPSDSFPGLTAIVSGGSPRTEGIFYDVAYDRSLNPPKVKTGNMLSGGPCAVGGTPIGTRTEYEEGVEYDQTFLNGIGPSGPDGGRASINPDRLPRDKNCNPVFPWNFVRTNTIFGVIHAAGGYTAWSDKHPSYLSVSGPGNGNNVDDFYAPEVNSSVVALPVSTPEGVHCTPIPDTLQVGSYTDSFTNIQCYDTLKVHAVLNEIDGKTHDGKPGRPVPNLLGMNFQAVSVGQKLIEYNDTSGTIFATGGYVDAIGTPSEPLLGEFKFVDDSIGEMVTHLKNQGVLHSTLIIITAKHGQSPIDPKRFFPIPGHSGANGQTPSSILGPTFLPDSEVNQIGPTEDDISLLWLKDQSQTANAVSLLETTSPPDKNVAGIGQIFWGPSLATSFNPPSQDPRTPDIIVTPNVGVIYTTSKRKQEEHGGFAHDDTNVIMLLSNPKFTAKTVTGPVETMQVAPTVLKALGLDPSALQAVKIDGTQVLPGVNLDIDEPNN
ncbi:MAG TPA: alkaline phosphatase family protein [Candidatus Acidoferrum sp.]|nr:alkaline phosphatase family protein [Candidatus Acidoferrum sp.]